MKKLVLLTMFITLPALSETATALSIDNKVLSSYQELCLREPDPVKRQNYCHMLENIDRIRQDTAVV